MVWRRIKDLAERAQADIPPSLGGNVPLSQIATLAASMENPALLPAGPHVGMPA